MMRCGVAPFLVAACGWLCCVAIAASQPAATTCQPRETSSIGEEVPNDVGSLLQMSQQSASSDVLRSSTRWGRASALSSLAATTSEASAHEMGDNFDCQEYPALCEAPFDCGRSTETASSLMSMATQGHADLHLWCVAPEYGTFIETCLVDKDLVKAAWVLYNDTKAGKYGDGETDNDAKYCFLEGHCTNTAVTTSTTLEEAERMCDYRYGDNGWTMSPDQAKSACAMGNFHCDVMYCKETYCTMPEYIKQFAHLQPETPGHLIQET